MTKKEFIQKYGSVGKFMQGDYFAEFCRLGVANWNCDLHAMKMGYNEGDVIGLAKQGFCCTMCRKFVFDTDGWAEVLEPPINKLVRWACCECLSCECHRETDMNDEDKPW